MKKKIKNLAPSEISALLKRFEPLRFTRAADLVYESQIPNTGIVLVNGKIDLLKRKKVQMSLRDGALLGIDNIVNGSPSSVACRVLPESEVILLNKNEILSAIKREDEELLNIIEGSFS